MGRELRKVIPNWEHPKIERNGRLNYQPMFDHSFKGRMEEWYAEWKQWESGTHKDFAEHGGKYTFWEWHGGPPDPEYHRPDWKPEEMTWFQIYETVSEGTPVTPPFATRDELVDYLVANGDFWDQERRTKPRDQFSMKCDPWPREAAEKFVFGSGWAPSFVSGPGINGLQPGHLVEIK